VSDKARKNLCQTLSGFWAAVVQPTKGLAPPPQIISHHKNFPMAYFLRQKIFRSFFSARYATNIGVSTTSVLARMESERWDYERIAGVMRNTSQCRGMLASVDAGLRSGNSEVTKNLVLSASDYIVWDLGEGDKWLLLVSGLCLRGELRDYRDIIGVFVNAAAVHVRTPAYRAFKTQQLAYRTEVLRGENDRAAAAAREMERARRNAETKERLALVSVVGAGVGAGYAGWGALIGSAVPGIGTALGAGVGGAIGLTVGSIFGAVKS
jgi:hypothetical protein